MYTFDTVEVIDLALTEIKLSNMMRCVEEVYTARWGRKVTVQDVLRKFYIDDRMGVRAIGREINIAPMTVSKWLKEFGIDSRKINWL